MSSLTIRTGAGDDAAAETDASLAWAWTMQEPKVNTKTRDDCKRRKAISVRIGGSCQEWLVSNDYACSRLQVEVCVVLFHAIDKVSTFPIYFQCHEAMNIGLETREFLVEVSRKP